MVVLNYVLVFLESIIMILLVDFFFTKFIIILSSVKLCFGISVDFLVTCNKGTNATFT